jgi:hypothetical protein
MPSGRGGRAEGDIVAGQPPVLVGDQVHHLVHHTVTDPGPLLSGGAIGEGVEGVQLRGADPGLVQPVQLRVAGAERRLAGEPVVVLAHRDVADGDLAGARRNHQEDLAEPVDVDGLVVVGGAAGDVAGAAAGRGVDRAGDRVVVRGLLVEQVEPHPTRGVDLQLHMTGHNPAEVHREQGHRIFGAIDFERKLDGPCLSRLSQLSH